MLLNSDHTGSPVDYEMDPLSGTPQDGYWNYTIPANLAGTTITYSIWVNDTNNNPATDGPYQYTIIDNENPNVISVSRDPLAPGNLDTVNITVHITDNVGVDTVLIYSNHTGSILNYEMDSLSGTPQDGYWNYTIPAYSTGTTINYSIWVNDTNNNPTTDGPYQYTIIDNEPPNIISVSRDPLNPSNLDLVNITVRITDNVGVATVLLNSDHTGSPVDYIMDPLSGTPQDGYWNYTIPAVVAETTVTYSIWVNDTNNNPNTDGPYQYTTYDFTYPNIVSTSRDPLTPGNLDTVNITVHVTDNVGVDTVLIYSNHTGSILSYEMDPLSGTPQDGYWNYSIPAYPAGTTINYSIWVNDTNNNPATDGPYQYTIIDNENPNVISDSRDPYFPGNLDTVDITVNVTDNVGVDTVLIYSNHSGFFTYNEMDFLSGTPQDGYWNYTIPAYPAGTTIIYSIWVNDTRNNNITFGPYQYLIIDNEAPNIILVSRDPLNPEASDLVNITVHITDNVGVDTVLIYSNHTGTLIYYEMDYLSGTAQDGYWNFTIPAYSAGTTINYSIWVNDTRNNNISSINYYYSVTEKEKPIEPPLLLGLLGVQGEEGIIEFLLSPLGFVIIGAIAALAIISIVVIPKRKQKFVGVGEKNLDAKLKNLVKSKTAVDFVKEKYIKDFFKKEFSTLSRNEIEKILQLDDLSTSEKIELIKELAGFSKEERKELLETLENIE